MKIKSTKISNEDSDNELFSYLHKTIMPLYPHYNQMFKFTPILITNEDESSVYIIDSAFYIPGLTPKFKCNAYRIFDIISGELVGQEREAHITKEKICGWHFFKGEIRLKNES